MKFSFWLLFLIIGVFCFVMAMIMTIVYGDTNAYTIFWLIIAILPLSLGMLAAKLEEDEKTDIIKKEDVV